MGKRGPPKKPTELKLVQGAPGGMSRIPLNEPKPEKLDDLTPPEGLTEEGQLAWKQIAGKLFTLNLLTKVDVNALFRYCDVWQKWKDAKNFLDKNGSYYAIYHDQTEQEIREGKKKNLKYMAQFPQVNIYSSLSKELSRLEREFGLTPASRASLGIVTTGKEKDEVKRMLYGTE